MATWPGRLFVVQLPQALQQEVRGADRLVAVLAVAPAAVVLLQDGSIGDVGVRCAHLELGTDGQGGVELRRLGHDRSPQAKGSRRGS
jgi:hypothetical protein